MASMTLAELNRLLAVPTAPDPTASVLAGVPPAPAPESRQDISRRVMDALAGVELAPPSAPTFSTQSAGTAYHPIAESMARWGANQQPGVMSSLALWAAPGVDWAERAARGVRGATAEATGVPAAARAGEALAAGDTTRAIGHGLMALPSRFAAIPGMIFSSADAQPPDPRAARIRSLDADIAKSQKAIADLGRRTRDPDRLEVLSRPHQQMLDRLSAERKGLQDAIDAEAAEAAAAERRRLAAAEWANTPTARAYPWSQPASTGLGLATGLATTFTRARGAVGAYNSRLAELDTQIAAAVDRARNARLTPQARTAAAAEARAAQLEFEQLAGTTPHLSRLGAAGLGFATTEIGTGAIGLIDYLSSAADPTGALRAYTLHANDPINNPGEMAARYLIPGAVGAGLGELGNEFGSRGAVRPTGHAAAVQSLNKRYTRRSR